MADDPEILVRGTRSHKGGGIVSAKIFHKIGVVPIVSCRIRGAQDPYAPSPKSATG